MSKVSSLTLKIATRNYLRAETDCQKSNRRFKACTEDKTAEKKNSLVAIEAIAASLAVEGTR